VADPKTSILQSLPFAGVLGSSLMIAWATEVTSFFLSRGLAFAILALIQVLPEFAVEAVITWQAAHDPTGEGIHLVTANFTGANRLLVGLFLPIVFFFYAHHARKLGHRVSEVTLPYTASLEVMGLLVPTLYSFSFAFRGSISLGDTVVLTMMYGAYLWMAYRLPAGDEDPEQLPAVPRYVMRQRARIRVLLTFGLFVVGGTVLFLSVEPFYENTLALAVAIGIPAYFLFQWIAPLLSEFPELITVSYWGRTGRAELGLTNVISSKINQWTLLIAMIPIVFAVATMDNGGTIRALPLDDAQQVEIILTAAQGLFAASCLLTLRFCRWQAWALLVLWAVQAADPLIDPYLTWLPSPFPDSLASGRLVREWFTIVYLVLAAGVIWAQREHLAALTAIRQVWAQHIRPGRQG